MTAMWVMRGLVFNMICDTFRNGPRSGSGCFIEGAYFLLVLGLKGSTLRVTFLMMFSFTLRQRIRYFNWITFMGKLCFKSTFEVIHNILHVLERLCLPVDDLGLTRLYRGLQGLGSLLGLLGELLYVGEQLLGDLLRALPRRARLRLFTGISST